MERNHHHHHQHPHRALLPSSSSSASQQQQQQQPHQHGVIMQELYFLIAKFLSHGPLAPAAQLIIAALEQQHILPARIDWTGHDHPQSYAELERKYSHIAPAHLLELCARIPRLLEADAQPSVAGIVSLLGAGRQSVLRTAATCVRAKSLRDHCTRWHAQPLAESAQRRPNNNIVHVLLGRQAAGPLLRRLAVPAGFYERMLLLRRTLGHLSAVYCVLFDRSGKYIITGADDLLVKLWSAIDGRLLATFRGASAEITDIAVNLDNTLLAAGSLDRILRVWDLQTAGPVAVLSGHTGMITSVNFCPSPRAELKYLVTTSTDGSVAFWQYGTPRGGRPQFAAKPIQYHEKLRPGQAQMICASFSPGGVFLAAGSADHHVRVYVMAEEGPRRILETEAHSDTVDSIQWAHSGLRFVSGSKDGMAHVWNFEAQQWRPLKLNMSDRLASCPVPEDESRKLKVTMVSWDFSDRWVITAVNDFTIKVWNATTGKLHRVMRGHTDELYVLESHPKDPHVLISAGHDGQLFVWNILEGVSITSFVNNIDGQGHGGVFDAKWSPDGSMIAATDSHGHILMYGFGSGHQRLKMLPKELFFHTDYRPLMRDVNHFVMDEQTQTIPHLMPPPFLVDVDGNPHPPAFQRLVPGRESCSTEQLVPNITMGPEGMEVVDSANNTVSNIDRLIAVLANRQGPAAAAAPAQPAAAAANGAGPAAAAVAAMAAPAVQAADGSAPLQQQRPPQVAGSVPLLPVNVVIPGFAAGGPVAASPRSVNGSISARVEGVRQSSGNWEREQNYKWIRRTYVRPMQYSRLQALRQATYVAGQQEHEIYKREMRRRPMMINTGNPTSGGAQTLRPAHPKRRPVRQSRAAASQSNATAGGPSAGGSGAAGSSSAGGASAATPAYRTRAVREREHPPSDENSDDHDDPDHIASASSATDSNDSTAQEDMLSGLSSSSGDSDSSDYSDWVANDQPGQALEPPKRSKRKPVQARQFSPPSSPEAATAGTADASAGDHADGVNAGASTSRGSARPTANGTGSRTRRPNGRSAGGSGGRRAPQRVQPIFENGEIPERYRPPEWLSEVIPRKAPYYPQMGDDVYYFRQGHQRYLDAVRTKAVYKVVGASGEPWAQLDLRDSEPVKVIGIKYEIRPPRLCCLKLALLNADGSLTGQSFAIKYHDMPDVLDFIVLAQTYQMAVQRLWTPGDRFRCMIDDSWWTGCIESRTALSAEFPSSLFMCFRTRWDNGEYEAMSPWDMEPIDQSRLPEEVGGQVPVEPEELRATLYQPKSEEWPRGDRDATCRRIVAGLDEVMGLAIADPFLVPVDLNTYPSYAFMVEYPIDLTTIKARFENHFYRRLTSAQFDVRYLATNAEKFNQSNSSIVKHARIITDLCLRIIKDQNEVDVGAVYHQLMDTYVTSDSEAETEVVRGTGGRAASTSAAAAAALASRSAAARPSSAAAAAAAAAATSSSGRRSTRSRPNEDWQTKCRDLLEMIWARDDSTPFREPVDLIEHPDYLASVDTPMDLRTVKEDLLGGNYHTIGEFVNDMRTIFSNSRNYNTNKRSRIYSMTLRLSNLFEAQLKVVTGKSAKRSRPSGSSRPSATNSQSTQAAGGAGGSSSTALTRRGRHTTTAHHTTGDSGSAAAAGASGSGLNNGAGPSGLQHQHANSHHHLHHPATHLRQRIQPPAADSDDDDDSDSEDIDVLFTFRHSAGSASTASTNNVSNASAPAGATTAAAGRLEPQPGPSGVQAARSSRRRVPGHEVHVNGGGPAATSAGASTARRSQQQQQRGRSVRHAAAANRAHNDEEEDDDDEEEEEDDDSDSSAASSSAAATSDSDRGHRSRRRKPPRKRTGANRIFSDGEWDSEESYQPTGSRKKAAKLDKRIAGRVAPAVAAAAAAETARPHALNGGRSTAAPPVAAGPSNTARRRLPAATAAAAVAATSDDDEEEDDDDYQAHDDEDVEEEEDDEEEEEDDDANDVDYNVNRTPKKTATAATTSTQKRGQPRSTGKKTPAAAAAAPTDPLVSSGSDDNGARRRSARKPVQRYESDHSYHLNASAGSAGSHKRRIQLDTDDDDEADDGGSAQPDTEQVDLDEEAHDDDDDDDDDGNELIETIEVIVTEELSQDSAGRPRRGNRLRTTTQPTRSGESDSEPLVQPTSSSQASASGARPLRSTRSTRSQADDDGNNDDDESDDDQVLSQLSNGYRSRPAAAAAPPSQRNGHDAAGPSRLAGHHESARRPVRSHVQEDHNYGESAPTLASRPGALRRAVALSRHQRNADELDVHPEASDSVAPLISGRLRRRPTPPAAHSSSSQEATQPQQQHHHRTRRATASQEKAGNGSDDSDDDDDDDKPLRFMATASSTASAQPAGGRQQRPQRRPPPAHADDNATAGLGASTARSTRTQKRPYYNEDSDDTAEPQRNHPPTKRLAAMRTDDDGGGGGGAGGAGNGQTDEFDEEDGAPLRRRRPAQRVGSDADEDADVDVGNDDDDDDGEGGDHGDGDGDHDQDDDDDDDDGEPSISVSSRGRVRRITAKARGLFRE